MSATRRRPIGDRVPDRSQTVADHMETRLYCTPITETLFEGLSIWLWNKQVMLGASKIMCVNGIMYAGEFFRRRYLGTRLVTDWMLRFEISFSRLSARLFHLNARWICADLTSQSDPVSTRAALICNFSSFSLNHYRCSPTQRCNNQYVVELVTYKSSLRYFVETSVLASSGLQVLQQLYRRL